MGLNDRGIVHRRQFDRRRLLQTSGVAAMAFGSGLRLGRGALAQEEITFSRDYEGTTLNLLMNTPPGPGPDVDRRRRRSRSPIPISSGSAAANRTTARARRGATASTSRPTAARPPNMGLRASRHINRIVIDPRDNNTVFVAATGQLCGARRRARHLQDHRRRQDLEADAEGRRRHRRQRSRHRSRRTARSSTRRRISGAGRACCINGGGAGSGIWKSTDGGETWTRLKGGVPEGPLGRIAVDVYRKRPNILYALIEGPRRRPRRRRRRRWRGRRRGGRARRGGGRGAGAEAAPAAAAAAARSTQPPGSIARTTRARRGAR